MEMRVLILPSSLWVQAFKPEVSRGVGVVTVAAGGNCNMREQFCLYLHEEGLVSSTNSALLCVLLGPVEKALK